MDTLVLGIDEVGRGALAGPVVVGACALPLLAQEKTVLRWLLRETGVELKDSKKLSQKQREKIAPALREAFLWGVGIVESDIVDAGLTSSLKLAADKAIAQLLQHAPGGIGVKVLADAGLFHSKEKEYPTRRSVKADEHYLEVAAASVLAKVARDHLMRERAVEFPGYEWEQNVGYGTPAHVRVIQKYGLTTQHRCTFCSKFLQSSGNQPMM